MQGAPSLESTATPKTRAHEVRLHNEDTMKRSLIAISLLSTLLLAGAALADGRDDGHPGRRGGEGFEKMDANRDGKLTLQEAKDAAAQRFSRLDTNKDGVVTKEEAAAVQQKRQAERAEKHFAHLDTNKDGKLSKEEAHMPDAHFAKVDTNKDGYLTKAELEAAHSHHQQHQAWGSRMFDHMDTDKDGKLTSAESIAGATQMFQHMDANKDGVITQEEMPKGPHRGGPRHPHGEHGKDKPQPKAN